MSITTNARWRSARHPYPPIRHLRRAASARAARRTSVVLVVVLAGLAIAPAASHASDYVSAHWGGRDVPVPWLGSVRVPGGNLDHSIVGHGTYIDTDSAWFFSPQGCQGDASLRLTYGYGAWRFDSGIRRGCSRGAR